MSQKKGGKKGRSDRSGSNLGRSIIKQQFPSIVQGGGSSQADLETERGKHKLRSVTVLYSCKAKYFKASAQ